MLSTAPFLKTMLLPLGFFNVDPFDKSYSVKVESCLHSNFSKSWKEYADRTIIFSAKVKTFSYSLTVNNHCLIKEFANIIYKDVLIFLQ